MKTVQVENWQQFLVEDRWHEVANMFPLLQGAELEELAASIKATNGLVTPVVLYEDKVLDGRNRLRGCNLAGIAPVFVQWDPGESDDGTPLSWVLAANGARRNMSGSQKAYVALQAILRLHGAEGLGEGERSGDRRIVISDKVGVGRHYVSDIITIWKSEKDERPETLIAIRDGVATITSVLREIAFRKLGVADPGEKECPPGQLAGYFLRLLPRHSAKLAVRDAEKTLRDADLAAIQKYWVRLEKEFKFYGE